MITADKYGNLKGKFSIPQDSKIPAGVKRVEFIGSRGHEAWRLLQVVG